MQGFSKRGIAVNELMGWILILFVIFVIVAIVMSLSDNFNIGVLNSIG